MPPRSCDAAGRATETITFLGFVTYASNKSFGRETEARPGAAIFSIHWLRLGAAGQDHRGGDQLGWVTTSYVPFACSTADSILAESQELCNPFFPISSQIAAGVSRL